MKNTLLLILLFVASGLCAQNALLSEKVLLTTDRTNYVPGDYVWLSGFVLNADDHSLRGNEYIMHICLYEPNGNLLKHELFPIKRGTFKGQVEISKLAKKGIYRLVAYTNFMRNWGDDFLCEKLIWVGSDRSSSSFALDYNWLQDDKKDSLQIIIKTKVLEDLFLNISAQLYTDKGKPVSTSVLSASTQTKITIPFSTTEKSDSLLLHVEVADDKGVSDREIIIQKAKGKPDVQFLPESGNLLAGIKQRIAFKAIGTDGFPIEISGKVTNQLGVKIADIETIFDGMGSFESTANEGEIYSAEITDPSGKTYHYQLPSANKEGAIIQITTDVCKGALPFAPCHPHTLSISQKGIQSPLKLVTHCRGKLLKTEQLETTASQTKQVDISNYPAGIIHFSLVDEANQPVCERLVFHQPKNRINVKLPEFIEPFKTRSEVKLPIEIEGLKEGQLALYSVSVVDENFVHDYLQETAETQLYLSSELPGFIPNATYYLNETEEAIAAVDLLMLTSGWCRFNWKEQQPTSENQNFEVETNICLKGQIRHILTNKPLKKNYAQGKFWGGGNVITLTDVTDKEGNFKFDFADVDYDLNGSLLFAARNGGTPRDVRATIQTLKTVQELDYAKANIVVSEESIAPVSDLLITNRFNYAQSAFNPQNSSKVLLPRIDNYFDTGVDTITLPIIEVKEKRIKSTREKMRDLVGTPQKIVTNKQVLAAAKAVPWYSSVWDLIAVLYPEFSVSIDDYLRMDIDLTLKGDTLMISKTGYKRNVIDLRLQSSYLYGIYSAKNRRKPVFVIVNGKRVFAHENPMLFTNSDEISIQNLAFKTIEPSEITSIELFDGKTRSEYFKTDYELRLANHKRTLVENDPILKMTFRQIYGVFYTSYVIDKRYSHLVPLILSITTKGGEGSLGNSRSKEADVNVNSFTKAKIMYQPNYRVSSETVENDQRTTLCWSPLTFRPNGKIAFLKFFTGDYEGEKKIVINGLSSDGTPFYKEASFHVGGLKVNQELADNSKVETSILEPLESQLITQTQNKEGENMVRKAIRYSMKQMNKDWINSAFFREKFYRDGYLVSLEDWLLKSKLYSIGYGNDDLTIQMEKGKRYTTFDFREVIKVLPNHRDPEFIYSADPLFVRKPFLDLDYLNYYQYSIVGETKVDTVTCYEVLFDVRKESFYAGFRGKLLIGKEHPFVYEASYGVSPTNRDFLDVSFFVHDCAEEVDLELEETIYKASYHCQERCYYPTSLSEKVTFSINHKHTQVFERELLTTGVSSDDKIKNRAIEDAEVKTYLVKNPMYDRAMFDGVETIKLPQEDLDEMKYLHEITRYW